MLRTPENGKKHIARLEIGLSGWTFHNLLQLL